MRPQCLVHIEQSLYTQLTMWKGRIGHLRIGK